MGSYLENYLESVANLPTEVKRNFTKMRELDSECQNLLDKLEVETRAYLKKRKKDKDKSVTDDRALHKIREDFQKAAEYGDEKVNLAVQTYELVDKQIRRLDADLKKFEAELEQDRKGKKDGSKNSKISKVTTKQEKPKARRKSTATATAATVAPAVPGPSMTGTDVIPPDARVLNVDIDMPIDPNEPTYCICNRVSFGEMVGCDNPDCKVEWFHFECVGLTSPPKGKWYCPDCSALRKKQLKKQ